MASPVIIDLSSDSEHDFASQSRKDDVYTLDWADDCYPPIDFAINDLENEPVIDDKTNNSFSSDKTEIYSTVDSNDKIIWDESPVKSQKSDTLSQKENNKRLREQKKLETKKMREEKKAEELKQKRVKAAMALRHKYLKPEENIKLLKIHIDTKIVNSEFGGLVITSLCQSGLNYDVKDQIKPSIIFWTKKLRDIIVSEEGITEEKLGEKEENQLIYIINSHEFVELVHANELLTHVQKIKSLYLDKLLTVVIFGMQKYFKNAQKRNKEKNSNKRIRTSSDADDIVITFDEYQLALTELELLGKCNSWPIETGEELASLIITTTKSLSQIDYKNEKKSREEDELDWFAKADSKNCVKVDKNGNGYMKLWQQQMCQFNAIGMEMATAITSKYHSPLDLVKSYEKCESTQEAKLLLQNIQMRREAGILSTSRRIGPEASKKLFHFYTSDNPDLEL